MVMRNYFAGDGQTHLGREGVREEVDAKDFSASIKNDKNTLISIYTHFYIYSLVITPRKTQYIIIQEQ